MQIFQHLIIIWEKIRPLGTEYQHWICDQACMNYSENKKSRGGEDINAISGWSQPTSEQNISSKVGQGEHALI